LPEALFFRRSLSLLLAPDVGVASPGVARGGAAVEGPAPMEKVMPNFFKMSSSSPSAADVTFWSGMRNVGTHSIPDQNGSKFVDSKI
jgi:hypothetical protein